MDALSAKARDAQALAVIGYGKPFGKRDYGVLGYRIGSGAELRQQSCRRGALQQIAALLTHKPWYYGTCGENMRKEVYFPDRPPLGVGNVQSTLLHDTRVRAKQIELAKAIIGVRDERLNFGLSGDVGDIGNSTALGRDFARRRFVTVNHVHGTGPLEREAAR